MINVVLYKFDKRSGSTKRPSSGGYSIKGNLNDNTDILNPSISFKISSEITHYNYAYIPDFNRFYTVSRWTYMLGLWRADLNVDVLASWKPEIGAIEAYILRSASQHNGNIVDGLYPTTPQTGILESSAESVFNENQFILHYVGKNGLKCALLSASAMRTLCASLWNTWGNIEGMSDVFAAVCDPFQYVNGIQKTYAPIGFWIHGAENATNVVLGTVDTGAAGPDLTNATGEVTLSLGVPKHPQSGDRPYLKAAPYSIYSIRIPGVGWISLPSEPLYNAGAVSVHFVAEPSSGNMRADILAGGSVIASGTGKVNVDWGIAGAVSSPGVGGILGKLAGGLGAGILNDLAGFIGSGAGVIDSAGSATATVQQSGGMSACVGMTEPVLLQLKYQNAVAYNNEDHGRPLMEFRTINTLTGYVLCEGAHFVGLATETERREIDDFLNGGFFYE